MSIDACDINDRGVIGLVGACATSRRGTEDDKGQGGGLWERGGSGVDGICEGKGVRDAPHQCVFECIYKCILRRVHCMQPHKKKSIHHLLKRLLEQFLYVVGMEEHVGVEVETLI